MVEGDVVGVEVRKLFFVHIIIRCNDDEDVIMHPSSYKSSMYARRHFPVINEADVALGNHCNVNARLITSRNHSLTVEDSALVAAHSQ